MAPGGMTSRKYDSKADIYSSGDILEELIKFIDERIDFDHRKNSDLKTNFSHSKELNEKMKSIDTKLRLNCIEILEEKEK
jgi:hypothetical protein